MRLGKNKTQETPRNYPLDIPSTQEHLLTIVSLLAQ
jgi:hypothetical protein